MKKAPISLLAYMLISCNLFDKQEQLIQTVNGFNGKVVKVYYVRLGATTNDVIQVRRVNNGNEEIIVHAYEHNFLNSAKFITKESLMIVLSDTSSIYGHSKKVDTVGLIIK